METLLILWTLFLCVWTLYLMLSNLALNTRRRALHSEQLRWLARTERINRENVWNQKTNG
jgi:hypothetical protein